MALIKRPITGSICSLQLPTRLAMLLLLLQVDLPYAAGGMVQLASIQDIQCPVTALVPAVSLLHGSSPAHHLVPAPSSQ